ncbi:MAG: hypothetical protein RIA71_11540 [Oceanicaulis sp.]
MMLRPTFALAAALAISSTAALAQDQAGPDSVSALLACRDQADAQARLACQDAAIAAFAAELDSGRLEIVSAEPSRSAIARFTGLLQRDEPDATQAAQANQEAVQDDGSVAVFDEDGEVDEMRGLAVARVTTNRFDQLTVYLENGQVWRQTETDFVSAPNDDELGDLTATIERGIFGARFMELSHNGRRFRARRIQ